MTGNQGSVEGRLRYVPRGAVIKALRLDRGLTQEQLAKKAGINKATIVRIEGERSEGISPKTFRGLVKALRPSSPYELMQYEHDRTLPYADDGSDRLSYVRKVQELEAEL